MMLFKKAMPRRTFLKGLGATVALPLLDGMIPAFATAADTVTKPAVRLGFVYVPNGIVMEKFTPTAEGTAFEFTPILEPLAPFQDHLCILTGLSNKIIDTLPGETNGPHTRASAGYLTGIHAKKGDLRAGISADQIAAKELGKHTQLASLELSLEEAAVGECDGTLSCAYTNTLSWRTPTTPMPSENNPRLVFERMFGDSNTTDPAERRAQIREDRSILDFVFADADRLAAHLGPTDRRKLTEYLDAIRDIERRIQMAEEKTSQEVPSLERPAGIPSEFEEHARLMFDLQLLAYQTDMTRVITFMMGHELSTRSYREIGIADPHHPLTHHRGDPEKIAKVIQINIYHAKTFSYYLNKLKATPDGDGSLLDHMVLLYGSGLGDGNMHASVNLPVVLAGGAAGKLKGGRHLRFPEDKNSSLTNLYLALLNLVGVPVDSLGDSTGKLELLAV